MKKLLLVLIPLLMLSGCGNGSNVYINDGDDVLIIRSNLLIDGEDEIETEQWTELTIEYPLAYVELWDGEVVFNLNDYSIIIDD